MRVDVAITETELETDSGRWIDSVQATCTRCDNETESFGTGDASRKRCLVLMREDCPLGENNFYVDEDE